MKKDAEGHKGHKEEEDGAGGKRRRGHQRAQSAVAARDWRRASAMCASVRGPVERRKAKKK